VPGKNFRTFAGKPLVLWILDTLLELPEIDAVVINTDARETLEGIGVHTNARVIIRDRRPEICGDFVSMNKVIADDLSAIKSDLYLMTHTTNPLIHAATIRQALTAFAAARVNGTADSMFTVSKFQTRFYDSKGKPLNHDPNNLVRTQDLEPWYEENSNLYLFTQESFSRTNARIGTTPLMFEIPRSESFDIDDAEGWEMAEAFALARAGACR
jgi:CMP-N-acetylneuraminic acid synthetase